LHAFNGVEVFSRQFAGPEVRTGDLRLTGLQPAASLQDHISKMMAVDTVNVLVASHLSTVLTQAAAMPAIFAS
jgi:hypothetical protein